MKAKPYVLVWPSEIGPCRLEVSERFFAARARVDLHAENSDFVLRYPPPAWTRVVERPVERSLLSEFVLGFSFLWTLACVLALASWGFIQWRGTVLDVPVPTLQQTKLIV